MEREEIFYRFIEVYNDLRTKSGPDQATAAAILVLAEVLADINVDAVTSAVSILAHRLED
jgi:hypothetical protein